LVISYANFFANGIDLDRGSFHGGDKTESFAKLRDEGFEIVIKERSENKNPAWLLTWNPKKNNDGGDGNEINQPVLIIHDRSLENVVYNDYCRHRLMLFLLLP